MVKKTQYKCTECGDIIDGGCGAPKICENCGSRLSFVLVEDIE